MEFRKFQEQVENWMLRVFGKKVLSDKKERTHRFIEEAIELAQVMGYTKEEMQVMIDYVYNRPPGEITQEVGGVLHCLAALCTAENVSMNGAAIGILHYCEERSDAIRSKHSRKPDSIASNKNYSNGEEKNTLPGS